MSFFGLDGLLLFCIIMGLRSASSAINVFVYLLRCLGRALSSTANILETNTITGASSEDLQVRKSEGKKKRCHGAYQKTAKQFLADYQNWRRVVKE